MLSDLVVWDILKLLSEFLVIVVCVSMEYELFVIVKYVIYLVKVYNKYYVNIKILVEDDELNVCLVLVKSVSIVLKEVFCLFGVKVLDEM